MASFQFNGIDDLVKDLDSFQFSKIVPTMIEEAAPILESAVKTRAAAHQSSGKMYASIKTTKVSATGDGYSAVVRPTGKDSKTGVRNMEKMAYLEYGTSKQAATPVISPAVRESESKVIEKMQEVFNREVDGI